MSFLWKLSWILSKKSIKWVTKKGYHIECIDWSHNSLFIYIIYIEIKCVKYMYTLYDNIYTYILMYKSCCMNIHFNWNFCLIGQILRAMICNKNSSTGWSCTLLNYQPKIDRNFKNSSDIKQAISVTRVIFFYPFKGKCCMGIIQLYPALFQCSVD